MGESVQVGILWRKRALPSSSTSEKPVQFTTKTILSFALLMSTAQAEDSNHVLVGLGAGYAPAYEGAHKYRILPLPAFDVHWGSFFANLDNGVGINIIDYKFVTV